MIHPNNISARFAATSVGSLPTSSGDSGIGSRTLHRSSKVRIHTVPFDGFKARSVSCFIVLSSSVAFLFLKYRSKVTQVTTNKDKKRTFLFLGISLVSEMVMRSSCTSCNIPIMEINPGDASVRYILEIDSHFQVNSRWAADVKEIDFFDLAP